MKGTFHKSCSCNSCRQGRNAYSRNLNERKLRRGSKAQISKLIAGRRDDVFIAPISSPYTD